RLGEAAGNAVLEPQQLLATFLRGDVAANAAIALEAAAAVEHRLAAQGHPDAMPVAGGALDLEVAERLAALELAAVALPVGVSQVKRGLLPALAAQVGRGVERALVAYVARHEGEPELGVLLPVPVRGKLRQAAEARRACAQHVRGRARARRAAGSVALATRNGFPCAGRAPAATCHGFPPPPAGNLLELHPLVQSCVRQNVKKGERSRPPP